MAKETIVTGAKTNQVVDELFDSITKHSIELQRMSNHVQKDLAKEYLLLSKELDSIILDNDFSRKMSASKRKKMLKNVIDRGRQAIDKSNRALASVVKKNLIDVGNLESEFSVGSINKAVTGKGNVAFVTNRVGVKKISDMADNLIINGGPQKEMWARHGVNLQNKFKDVIRDGWQLEQDVATVSQRIRGTAAAQYKDGIMNVSKHQADSLARTSLASIANQTREETYLANNDVIEGVQFIAVLDNRTTPICKAHSGDKWDMTPNGWVSVDGAHDYRAPPLHFNCRSTLVPRMYSPKALRERAPDKLAMVPKDKAKTLGKPLGIRVCRSPCKYIDADAWLKTQPLDYQKDVLGKAYSGWKAGELSFKRMVTQKGRTRTTEELAKLYAQQGVIPDQISALKSTDTFKPFKGASKEFRDELAKTEKGAFLQMEERLMTGQKVSKADSDKFGNILKNADPKDLEYSSDFKPDSFNDLLGNKAKRLAFYNHTAKRFERISKLHKGDLSKRKTSRLGDIDTQVLQELKDKITADTVMSSSSKKILLEMFDESSRIVGTQRSLPMIESLFTLARKADLKDIDGFVGYLNNSMGNAVNSYFSRVKRLEIRTTASSEKIARFNTLSENAKTVRYKEINRASTVLSPKVSLAEANEVKRKISTIGKRKLRDFEGETPNHLNVDLEILQERNLDLYLKYLQDDVRMTESEMVKWMKRVRSEKYRKKMTPSEELHLKRVNFIMKRTKPGDKVLLTDEIMENKLFKNWLDNAWTGRGFPPAIRDEVGLVLGDVEIYQGLKAYIKNKRVLGTGTYEEIIGKASNIRGSAGIAVETDIDPLYALNAQRRKKTIELREKALDNKLNKEGFFARIGRKEAKQTRAEKLQQKREFETAKWENLSDAKFVKDVRDEIDGLVINNYRNPKSPFFTEANLILKDDAVKLAQLVGKETFFAAEKGATYINAVRKLGERYYYQFRGVVNPSEDDAIRMGHFLYESMVKSKLIKRVKVVQRVAEDGRPPRDVMTWQIKVTNDTWEESFLANKKNYEVDGLPSVGKPPKVGKDGLYETGQSSIRVNDKEWVGEQAAKRSSKPWIDNLNIEAGTGIKVNGYIYDVMTELEKRGKSIIPKAPKNIKDVVERSKYDSYSRARKMAKGLRDDTFFNRMSNDRFARTYADTTALHWQGDDINRGLMAFSKGAKLGKKGFDDFSRNFMNVAGYDKVPMNTRIKLFKKIPDKLILETAKDPLKNDWWYNQNDWMDKGIFKNLKGLDPRDTAEIRKLAEKADPSGEGAFQFLAMIKERAEMIKWTKSGKKLEDFVSHLPSQRDGTTNVLQHFAGISRDKSIAESVNMTKQRGVADAYIQLRDAMDDIGKSMDANNPLKKYIDIPGLTHAKRRKSVKKGLMTSQYNAGASTLGEGYFEALSGVQVNGKFIFRDAPTRVRTQVGKIMLEAAEKQFPQATKVRYLLNNLAEAHEISGASSIEVKTPLGFPFRQSYKHTTTRQVELRLSDNSRMKLNVNVELDDIDYAKQNRAFAPNIIHAMDASHKSLVANRLFKKYGIKDFSMIHDSFGAHFGNMDLLLQETRGAFLEMYEGKNFMEFLYGNFKKQGIKMKRYVRNANGTKIKDGKGGFLTEDIPLEEIRDLGDYDFKDFQKLEYFFH